MWIGPGWYADGTVGAGAVGRLPQPAPVEAELVHQAYAVICPERTCRRCGRPLRPTVVVEAEPPTGGARWSIVVRARCAGWRRHLQRSRASCDRDGIHLGTPGAGAEPLA